MRMTEEAKITTNSTVAHKLHKHIVAEQTGKCSICPYHDRENRTIAKRGKSKRRRNA